MPDILNEMDRQLADFRQDALRLLREVLERVKALEADARAKRCALLLSRGRVAEILDVSPDTVRRLVRTGKLREVEAGGDKMGRKRYRRRDVEKLAETGWKWE